MPAFSTLADDFEDGTIGAAWAPSYGTITEANGKARILSENGYPGLRSESVYALTSSEVFMRVFPAPKGDATGSVTSEALIDSPTGGTRLLIAVDTFSGQIQFRSDAQYGDDLGVTLTYDPTAHAWWRFRETGGTVYMETSPDAATWTIRRQVPTPAWITTGNNPLHFSTHRETGTLTGYYFDVDAVNVGPVSNVPPATPTGVLVSSADTSAVVSWDPTSSASGYDLEYREVLADTTVNPWTLVTIPGSGTSDWTQVSGPPVTLSVTGLDANFIAPPSMSSQEVVLDNAGRQISVKIRRSRHGIRQADGTVKPVRFSLHPVKMDPALPAHDPTLAQGWEQATVDVDAAVRSYTTTSHTAGGDVLARTVARPIGVTAGDLLVLYGIADTGTTEDLVLPAGFTELGRVIGNPGARQVVGYKVATASEPASYTYGRFVSAADGVSMLTAVKDWSGSTAGLAFAISAATNTTLATPSVTPSSGRNLLLASIATDDDSLGRSWGWVPPQGAGAVGYAHNAAGWASGCVSQEVYNSTAATGPRAWKVNSTSIQTTRMTTSLAVPSGTKTATLTQFLADWNTSGGSGGELVDAQGLEFIDSANVKSTYHLFAQGLDWTKRVGLLIYTDGSAEYGLKNPGLPYLLGGENGLIAVAKRHNMVLLTPLAPGGGCVDGDGTCWYGHSEEVAATATTPAIPATTPWQKLEWSNELIRWVMTRYDIDRRRIALGGYSSGAQWVTGWWGPRYASEVMHNGVAVAISYGGPPRVRPKISSTFKTNVPFVWDVGTEDTSITRPTWDDGVRPGRTWYKDAGLSHTGLVLAPGVAHDRYDAQEVGEFGPIMEREITNRVMNTDGITPTPPAAPTVTPASLRAVATATVPAATANKSVALPTGTTAGDLLLMVFTSYGTAAATAALPTGFTLLGMHSRTTTHTVFIGYKTATATEPTTYTPTVPTDNSIRTDLFAYRDATIPMLGVPAMLTTAAAVGNHPAPSITPDTANGVLLCWASGGGGNTWTPPTGMTERSDATTGASHYLTLTTADQSLTSGADTGVRNFVNSSGAYSQVAGSIFIPSAGTS